MAGRGLSEEASGWLSGSSHFCLKTLGLSPPTVLWTPEVAPKLPGIGEGVCVNQWIY